MRPGRIEIKSERSPFSMPRLDDCPGSAIRKRRIGPDRRHEGKVAVTEPIHTGRYEDAIWGFSLRMPLPHHRRPDEDS